ncbi:MAG: PAS domain S-box protein [Oligoflexales bacterium]|nr:PAS domain S-box protein [Oligoflexales bacterium]
MSDAAEQNKGEQHIEQVRRFHASHKIITIITQSKANIELLVDHLPDLFAIIDINGYICRGNYRLAEIFGLHIEKLLGAKFSHLFKEKTWEIFYQNIKKLKDENDTIEFELNCDANPYKVLNVNWRITEFRANKKTKGMYCIMGTDLTDLRTREKELENLTHNLQELVQEKTADITNLLDSIEQGIITINPDFSVNEAHSKYAELIFETAQFAGKNLSQLFQFTESEQKDFESWFKMINDPKRLKRWQKYLSLCPFHEKTIDHQNKKRILKIEYRPIIKNGSLSQLMIICSDVTEKRKAEAKLLEVKKQNELEMQRVLGIVNNRQVSLSIFFEETLIIAKKLYAITDLTDLKEHTEEFYRLAHTVKGNAGTFGFEELSRLSSELEDILSEIINNPETSNLVFNKWLISLGSFTKELRELLEIKDKIFSQQSQTISVLTEEYQKLADDLKNQRLENINDIYIRLLELKKQPIQDFCQKYNNIIKMYRSKLKKDIKDLVLENPKTLVHKETISIMDTAILHIIRNAIDHGIEDNEDRENQGKGPGVITVAYELQDHQEEVVISDDGRGIDAEKIATKALEAGIIEKEAYSSMSPEEKLELIFKTGFTTKDKVTSISGRGAGLGAARSHMEKHGGTLKLQSTLGKGTKFTLTLPLKRKKT